MATNSVIVGISKALSHWPTYKVYDDTVEQNLEYPCFIVKLVNSRTLPILMERHQLRQTYAITFIGANNSDVWDVSEAIPRVLEEIELDAGIKLYGHNITVTLLENHAANIVVDYVINLKSNELKDLMQSFKGKDTVKA